MGVLQCPAARSPAIHSRMKSRFVSSFVIRAYSIIPCHEIKLIPRTDAQMAVCRVFCGGESLNLPGISRAVSCKLLGKWLREPTDSVCRIRNSLANETICLYTVPAMANYALILAGGSGTRFWPLSRNAKPKQLLDLFGNGTMLRQAVERLGGLVPAENIFILTNALQEAEVRRQVPELPAANIVAEPARRDTAPAVSLGVALIAARDPQANMIVIPSDSLILDDSAFRSLAADALSLAGRENALMTIGIRPTWACPSYGYIERAGKLNDAALSHDCYEVVRFREKPDAATAEQYLASGNFTWNAGMFIWNVAHVRAQLATHTPELADFIDRLTVAQDIPAFIDAEFAKLTPISIDFALMEKADRVLNFEASFDWDDVGSWISVGKYLKQDEAANAANTALSAQDSARNIVFSAQGKHVALVGVDDLIVVDTGDALLVAHRDQADKIKNVVAKLPDNLV